MLNLADRTDHGASAPSTSSTGGGASAPAAPAPVVVVFLGPSLPVADARRIFPGGIFLPPARQGDLLSAVGIHRPQAIALLDGEFGQSLSVWHKEILFALNRGIHVFGASSMGALRGAECAVFGMKGVGRVFSMFASGELSDDDEVALAHAHDEAGYRALSEPMVNIRVTLADAQGAGVIDAETAERLVGLAKGRFFPERSYAHVLRLAQADGVPAATVQGLREWIAANRRDVKREDAIELLATMAALPRPLPPFEPGFVLERTQWFEGLYQRDRMVHHGGEVSLADIHAYAALHVPAFGEFAARALDRELVRVLAGEMGVKTTPEMIADETRRLRVRLRIGKTDEDLTAWMRANDLEQDEFDELMRGEAEGRALRKWLSVCRGHPRITREILDQMRLSGTYPDVARRAAEHAGILAREFAHHGGEPTEEVEWLKVVVEHMRATACRMDTAYTDWAEEVGIKADEFRSEVLRARSVRRYLASMVDGPASEAAAGAQAR
jgi:hypothetical protein